MICRGIVSRLIGFSLEKRPRRLFEGRQAATSLTRFELFELTSVKVVVYRLVIIDRYLISLLSVESL